MPKGGKPRETITLSEFARDHGVGPSTVTAWVQDGMPCRMVDGQRRIVRAEANPWVRDKVQPRGRPTDKSEAGARKLAAEARLAELELEEAEGRMVTVDDATAEVQAAYEQVRSQLVTLPQRWAPALLACKTLAQMTTRLDEAVREAMTALVEEG